MGKVIICRGIPGVGKSSYIKKNFPQSCVVSADHFFTNIEGEYTYDPTKIGEAHSQCMRNYIIQLSNKPLIVVDNTNVRFWEYENYIALGKQKGYDIHIIEFYIPDMKAFKKCFHRQTHKVPLEKCLQMWFHFEESPMERITFVPFSTSQKSL